MAYHRKRAQIDQSIYFPGVRIYAGENLFHPGFPVGTVSFGHTEGIIGEGHPWNSKRASKKTFTDVGGNCVVYKHWYEDLGPQNVKARSDPPGYTGVNYRYDGPMSAYTFMGNGIPSFATVPSVLSDSTLTAKGVEAWNSSKPTKPEGSLGQALGEAHQAPKLPAVKALRDALAQAPKGVSLRKLLKSAGGEFLNVGFGWAPLVSDLSDFIVNTINLEKRIRQLERDNGRAIRRTRTIKGGSNTSVTSAVYPPGNGSIPSFPGSMYDGNSEYNQMITEQWDYRFSARFRYYIDFAKARNDDINALRQVLRMTYGLDFNLSTAYELMPWSWLIDYFTNIGDNIDNLVNDSSDNLVADYAYINGMYTKYTLHTINQKLKFQGDSSPIRMQCAEKTQVFKRIKASPYGFGLSFSGLSPKRLAILAALGLNKLL